MKIEEITSLAPTAAAYTALRGQRRYEIAKQYFDLAMVPYVGRYHPDKAKMEASRAVEYADALLTALER